MISSFRIRHCGHIFSRSVVFTAVLAGLLFSTMLRAAESPSMPKLTLKKGERLVMIGDSITEGACYSKLIELYLTACLPELDLRTVHLGWSGASSQALRGCLAPMILPWKPDIVTIAIGGADGGYRPWAPQVGEDYATNVSYMVETLKNNDATVVVGSPCPMDPKFATTKVYDDNIAQLSVIAKKTAETYQTPFADVNATVSDTLRKARAELGDSYPVCGHDGIHPGLNGGLAIAYAFLKAMGVDGNIGTITFDLKGNATATEGHKILSCKDGMAEIESSKYPFCFSGEEKTETTRGILPYLPFNRDLNRFTLVVRNMDAERATVTWGDVSKSFTRGELERGINLADAFVEKTPFSETFQKADAAVYAKQVLELQCKSAVQGIINVLGNGPKTSAQCEQFRKFTEKALEQSRLNIRALLIPVNYTLSVAPEAPKIGAGGL
jgi:hypothetical protein